MSYILNIETATKNCSVSIGFLGQTVILKELSEEQFNHAEKLHVFIDECLQTLDISYQDLVAVAVSKGPGSYTGLRIGVSAAKGFCYALDIPLIAIDTLEILALQVATEQGCIIPMIDARRMEVFTQIYNNEHKAISDAYALIITETSFEELQGIIHFCGDGAVKSEKMLNEERFRFHSDVIYPSAQQMSMLSFNKFQKQQFEQLAYFEPYYLKDFMLNVKK